MPAAQPYRVAIYFAPAAGSALAEAAADWFAGDAPWLDTPRRYGFHATLKAPFCLRPGRTMAELDTALQDFAATTPPGPPLDLVPVLLDGFVALVPHSAGQGSGPGAGAALEAAVVRGFEPFRAPLTAAEVARRRAGGLTPRQDALLCEFGYPLVLEEFRFHMTLSARLAGPEGAEVLAKAQAHFADALATPVPLDRIWLFLEPQPNSAFMAARSFVLAGASTGMAPAPTPGKTGLTHA